MTTINDIIKSFKEDLITRIQGVELSKEFVNELISRSAKGYVPICNIHILEIAKQTPFLINSTPTEEPVF